MTSWRGVVELFLLEIFESPPMRVLIDRNIRICNNNGVAYLQLIFPSFEEYKGLALFSTN